MSQKQSLIQIFGMIQQYFLCTVEIRNIKHRLDCTSYHLFALPV